MDNKTRSVLIKMYESNGSYQVVDINDDIRISTTVYDKEQSRAAYLIAYYNIGLLEMVLIDGSTDGYGEYILDIFTRKMEN